MSDDDYMPDSPYDGSDDLFWNEYGSQNLADDLAERTLPSPIYFDNPAYEMMAGYSDWEYYSDDYYDDDPKLLKNNPQAGSPPAALKRRKKIMQSRDGREGGKQDALVNTKDIPEFSLGEPESTDRILRIGQNIKGTVWKKAESAEEELYQQGEAKKVALLRNWRDIFRESQPKRDWRLRSTVNRKNSIEDEWANNLGLAEMGFRNARGKMSDENLRNRYGDDEDGEIEVSGDAELDDSVMEGENSEAMIEDDDSAGNQFGSRKKRKREDEEEGIRNMTLDDSIEDVPARIDFPDISPPRKRRTSRPLSAPKRWTRSRRSSAVKQKSPIRGTVDVPAGQMNGVQGRSSIREDEDEEAEKTITAPAGPSKASTLYPASLKGRKRKASPSPAERHSSASEASEDTTARKQSAALGGRSAKRIASNKPARHDDEGNAAPAPKPAQARKTKRNAEADDARGTVRRSTRTRAKAAAGARSSTQGSSSRSSNSGGAGAGAEGKRDR